MLRTCKNSNTYFHKIEKIKKVLKAEKVREQITIEELMNINQEDKSHKQKVKNYLNEIKSNILKLNYLLDSLDFQDNISNLSVAKLAQQETKLQSFL